MNAANAGGGLTVTTQPLARAGFVGQQEFMREKMRGRMTVSNPETVNSEKPKRDRNRDTPKYKAAEDTAAFITRSIHNRTPFEDEDSYREYYRECREDIYWNSWSHDYF